MDREILFRAVSQLDGNWVYGSLIKYEYERPNVENLSKPHIESSYDICRKESDWCFLYKNVPVFEETIGQYTGLTDKNGTKIFEGDIVELWCERSVYGRKQSAQDKYIKVRAVVEWGYQYSIGFMLNYNNEHNKKLCIAKNKEHYDRDIGKRCITDLLEKKKYIRHEIWKFLDDIEVIGNIHDNPEFLEGL